MKKQTPKKLVIARESILTLTEPLLEEVNGGAHRPSNTIIRTCTC
jgi:hypothetical protein